MTLILSLFSFNASGKEIRLLVKLHPHQPFNATTVSKTTTGNPLLNELNKTFNCRHIRTLLPQTNLSRPSFLKRNLDRVLLIKLDSNEAVSTILDTYNQSDLFEYVEIDHLGRAGGQRETSPGDSYYYRQWSLENSGVYPTQKPGKSDADIDMDQAWTVERGSSSLIVAILDSGCKLDHPELNGRVWQNVAEIPANGVDDDQNGYIDDTQGWNFVSDTNSPLDDYGHGTNIAGIIGANADNDLGYAGIDWNCTIMTGKILDSGGFGYYSWWAEAIHYAVNNGARIINLSVGGSSPSNTLREAILYANDNNVICVACMMNENNDVSYYPAAFNETIAVGATDTDDSRVSSFSWDPAKGSNFGNHIDFCAPGHYIYGLDCFSDSNYDYYWGGTSQATPHVAGLISLLLAQDSSRVLEDIYSILRTSSTDLVGKPSEDVHGWDQYHGYGRINAYQALSMGDTIISIYDSKPVAASSFSLLQNFPNPFNPATTITYELKQAAKVTLVIYNVQGQQITKIIDGHQNPGSYSYTWKAQIEEGNPLPSGIYFYKLSQNNSAIIRKMTLLR